ncbi:MAG: CDP-alcohol phosphatidyltransferase family protein [Polyangiales bacterium]
MSTQRVADVARPGAPPGGHAIPTYRETLKPLPVEEPVDLVLHRPLGYLVARLTYPTPITPDQLTWLSMFVGVGAAASLVHAALHQTSLAPAAVLLVMSAVIDCSDGQLARMRRSSSTFGRMLDGAVDAIVQAAVLGGVLVLLVVRHRAEGPAALAVWITLWVLAVWVGTQHMSLYDRYKNLYLRHTQAGFNEDDDDEEVDDARRAALARGMTLGDRLRYLVYPNYLKAQRRLFAWVDPAVPGHFREMIPHTPEVADRYRAHSERLMRAWCWFGIGTHIASLALALAMDRVELYMLARIFAWNAALAVLIPLQRKASRAFFEGAR